MATYELRIPASLTDIEAQIEALRGIGAVDLIFTIEADTKREAIKETIEVVEEFNATYRGNWTSEYEKDAIRDGMKNIRTKAPSTAFPVAGQ